MKRNFQAMRIAGEQRDPVAQPLVLSGAALLNSPPPTVTPDSLYQKFDEVQGEMDALRAELNVLRRRDETLNFYMQRLDDELRLAARLQQDFLPKTLPQLGKLHFHTLFRPAGYVSGDLYDVMRLDEKHVGFYIADAVGHGMPAALLTMFIKHALVTKEIRPGGYRLLKPSESIGRLNEALIEQNLANATFATALYGMINIDTLELTMACAGHPTPVVLRENGPLENVPVEGGLLGIFPGEVYADFTMKLSPGDRLIMYTDGIEVAFCDDPATGDPNRWRDELLARRSLPSATLLSEFSDMADKESGSLEPKDDLTIVVMEVAR
ncbi:MAG TPA: SpoIIE family protein phosphatase [Tepidisphaeraceae bacterium]|jgi:serine phosphatase RsbU (regulator of sigma subunit)|nr:SpoIIE family protein phosphatase [Tepidisphaeraceae bacterium]